MRDLISKEALIRKLFFAEDGTKYPTIDIDNFPLTITLEELRKIIYDIPTVYDVDKAVEQLEELQQYYIYSITDLVKLSEVIEIIKGGGQGERY